jgi:hypothetical protein
MEVSMNLYWDNQIRARVRPDLELEQMDYFAPITFVSVGRIWKHVQSEKLLCASET